jgi:trehalose 6-phosphate phosphatase
MLQSALPLLETLRTARATAGMMLLGLDFDGTLAPIVPDPDDAALPDHVRPLLEALVARSDTRVALVSGRGVKDLRRRVDVDAAWYAGNHGLEIEGPGVRRVHDEAQEASQRLPGVVDLLRQQFAGSSDVIIEDKSLTVSIHYRIVTDERRAAEVRRIAHDCCRGVPGMRATDGRKVVEIGPDVAWHKGSALGFLRDRIVAPESGAPVLFLGDDRTDEDAFHELGDDGWSIVVGDSPRADTAARASLASTAEVADFLRGLA